MILRRLATSLRRQDWFTVAVELLILIVGIFLGLRVDEWNSARKDRADEQQFIERLHEDILLADELSSRVRERRLGFLDSLKAAADVLFGRADHEMLTDSECKAIGVSHHFHMNVAVLPSVDELLRSGRLRIVRDLELRTEIVQMQQIGQVLREIQNQQSPLATDLSRRFPDALSLRSYLEESTGEVRYSVQCDLAYMLEDQGFLNGFSANIDRYDLFVRDGLAPWSEQLRLVHRLVDARLGIDH